MVLEWTEFIIDENIPFSNQLLKDAICSTFQ